MSADQTVRAYLADTIDRPEFIRRLRAIGVTAGAAFGFADALTGYRQALAANGETPPASGHAALSPAEYDLVEAIAERILPATDTPGAKEALAVNYIDIALAGANRSQLSRYQSGLAALQKHCTTALNKPFTALGPAEQDALLEDLEAGKLSDVEGGPAFFELMRRNVMEGFFCEPQYGGNHDMVGWKLVGFPGAQYGYADAYVNRVIDLPPVATTQAPGARG